MKAAPGREGGEDAPLGPSSLSSACGPLLWDHLPYGSLTTLGDLSAQLHGLGALSGVVTGASVADPQG